jgi:prefoldin subunit 5
MIRSLQRFLCVLVIAFSLPLSLYSMEAKPVSRWLSVCSLFSVGKTYVSRVASPLMCAFKNSLSYVKAQPERVGLFAGGAALFTISFICWKNVRDYKRQVRDAKQDADQAKRACEQAAAFGLDEAGKAKIAREATAAAFAAKEEQERKLSAEVQVLKTTIAALQAEHENCAQVKQAYERARQALAEMQAEHKEGDQQKVALIKELHETIDIKMPAFMLELSGLRTALKEKQEDLVHAQEELEVLKRQQADSDLKIEQEGQQALVKLRTEKEEQERKLSAEVQVLKTTIAALQAEHENCAQVKQAYEQARQALAEMQVEHKGCDQFMQDLEVARREWHTDRSDLLKRLTIAIRMLNDVTKGALSPAAISLEQILRPSLRISVGFQETDSELSSSPVLPAPPLPSLNTSPLAGEPAAASAIRAIDPEIAEDLMVVDASEEKDLEYLETALRKISKNVGPNVHLGDSPTGVNLLDGQSSCSAVQLVGRAIASSPTLVRRRANSFS